MKRKILPVLLAMILMVAIAAGAVGVWLHNKYSYGTEVMDLKEYFGVDDDHLAVYLQDEKMPQQALL